MAREPTLLLFSSTRLRAKREAPRTLLANPSPNLNPHLNRNRNRNRNPNPSPSRNPSQELRSLLGADFDVDRLLRRAPRLIGSSTASLAAALAALEAMVAELLPARVCALDLVAAQPTLLGNDVPKRVAPI